MKGVRRAIWASGVAVAACALLVAGPSAQQAGNQPPEKRVKRFNTIAERFEKGEPSFNGEAWQLVADLEHNPFLVDDVETRMAALKPAGARRPVRTPAIRIPYEADQDYRHIVKQFLDAGIMGIIVPGVETAEQALFMVRSMRYPAQKITKPELRLPAGVRGWNPNVALGYWGWSADDYATGADVWPLNPDGELMAIAMIETPTAVKNIRQILGVPGVSAVLIGQSDMSISMGLGTPANNPLHPEVEAQVAEVARACVEMKKLCGSFQGDVKTRLAQGFKLFVAQRPGNTPSAPSYP